MSDSKEILDCLNKNGIKSFWHFTQIKNISGMKDGVGLLSKQELENKGLLNNISCGGNDYSHQADKEMDNWDKISLSFIPHTPMFYKSRPSGHFIMIEVKQKISEFDDIYFTNKNALKKNNGRKREKGLKGLQNVKFEYINAKENSAWDKNWREYVQAEILVPRQIQSKFFEKIHFVSPASKLFAELILNKAPEIFNVSPEIFSNFKNTISYNFSFLNEIFILKNSSYVSLNFNYFEDGFLIVDKGNTTFRMSFFSIVGTKLKILLDNNISKSLLLSEDNTVMEFSFNFDKDCNITISLDNIDWLSLKIRVK